MPSVPSLTSSPPMMTRSRPKSAWSIAAAQTLLHQLPQVRRVGGQDAHPGLLAEYVVLLGQESERVGGFDQPPMDTSAPMRAQAPAKQELPRAARELAPSSTISRGSM